MMSYENSYLDIYAANCNIPSKEKFRTMVCSTHIATGACPYGRKCVFLHDPRLNGSQLVSTGRVKYIKGIANNKIVTKDCFYYPDQSKECSRKHTDDSTGIPTNDQQYNIPQSFRNKFASYHNKYLFSLWNHFIENINGSIAAVPTVTPSSIAISSPIGSSLPSNVVIPSSSIPYSNLRSGYNRMNHGSILTKGNTTNKHVESLQRLHVFIMLSEGVSLS